MRPSIVVAIADLQCGHRVGLTPPEFQFKPEKRNPRHNKWFKIQRALWREYVKMIRRTPRPDVLFVNGDIIDGRGEKSGGIEQITTDRNRQAKMGAACINRWKAPVVALSYGTTYHVASSGEQFEDQVLDYIKAPKKRIGAHSWIGVNGCIFDVKHHCGTTNTPHTKATPLMKDQVWNVIWASRKEQPLGNIVIRSHVHGFIDIKTADVEVCATPALQGMGSRFGAERCSRTVDFGIVWWEVYSKHLTKFHADIVKIPEQKARVWQV